MAISIAIDGPAGAGKSTIARAIAKELGFLYLDTGAMYRTCGLKAARTGADPNQTEDLIRLIADTHVEVAFREGRQVMLLDGEDVTDLIRSPEISRWASDISRIEEVRRMMVDAQREIAGAQNVVMDGRDIGTHVLPNADLKIFLTASLDERARRRHLELNETVMPKAELDHVREDIAVRDRQDMTREHAPLRQADDAILIDSSSLSIEDVIARVLTEINKLPVDRPERETCHEEE